MLKIKQAPTKTKKLGNSMRRFEQTNSFYEIPQVKGKWQHGLKTEEEVKIVEEFYGESFSNMNSDVWGNLKFKLSHFIEPIDYKEDPEQLLKLRVWQAMGVVAESLEESLSNGSSDFVLFDEEEEVTIKASLYQRKAEGFARLFELKKTPKHCIAIAKYLLPSSLQLDTLDKAYVKLTEYVDGKVLKKKNEAVDSFFRALAMDKKELYVTVDFNEAFKTNIIRKNDKGRFYNPMSQTELGRTVDEAISYLSNPKNQDELGTGAKSDQPYSIRTQLKQLNK